MVGWRGLEVLRGLERLEGLEGLEEAGKHRSVWERWSQLAGEDDLPLPPTHTGTWSRYHTHI